MKVSGFTFVRNALKYDYPIVESIQSLLPIVDEYIVCAGNSEDATLQLIENIHSPKIKIIHSVWDDNLREGGRVLAVETDKAKAAVSKDSDWLFYLQGDECIHEKDHQLITNTMKQYKNNANVEGLLFNYHHFYGAYQYVGDSRRWYNKEIRIIRNNPEIKSWKDAQGFRKNEEKLYVKTINAFIYHYGWVKNPFLQKQKQEDFGKLWTNDDLEIEKYKAYLNSLKNGFAYGDEVDSLKLFNGTHPSSMKQRINNADWQFEFDINKKHFRDFKSRLLYAIEKTTGKRLFDYKNYKII
ncbi:MAG: glycosyltransferase family 2 protein [Chitinophagaceae bacterium]|nr:glycosyltransferase family 2 protein [Chitinophagaceae bacterium]